MELSKKCSVPDENLLTLRLTDLGTLNFISSTENKLDPDEHKVNLSEYLEAYLMFLLEKLSQMNEIFVDQENRKTLLNILTSIICILVKLDRPVTEDPHSLTELLVHTLGQKMNLPVKELFMDANKRIEAKKEQ